MPELVIDGETGFLVEPGNVGQLVERLEKLLGDPELAEEMGQRRRNHILKNFDEEKIMDETIQALRRVSEENSRD